MKPIRIIIILVCFLIPIVARTLWFYQGVYSPGMISTPDYASLNFKEPKLSTPVPEEPIKTSIKPIVVFDMSHTNSFFFSEIDSFTRALNNLGAQIEISDYNLPLADQLKSTSAYVVILPTSFFTTSEMDAVIQFVERGGRLLVIADPTRDVYSDYISGTSTNAVDVLNLLTKSFDIAFSNDYVYNLETNESNFRNVIYTQFGKSDIVKGLSQVVLYSAQSILTGQNPIVIGDKNTLSSLTDQGGNLILAATGGNDKVLAVGDMTFMTNPYIQVADNQHFMANIANFLVTGIKTHDLVDFPRVFKRNVTLLTNEKIPMDSKFLGLLSSVQDGLNLLNIKVQISDKPTAGNDLLVVGTYKIIDDLKPYTDTFGLKFDIKKTEEPSAEEMVSETPTPEMTLTVTMTPEVSGKPEPTSTSEETVAEEFSNGSVTVPGFGKLP